MNFITKNIMTNILSFLLTAVMCLAGTGCGQEHATPQQEHAPALKVVYDLPEGWEWMDEENGISKWEHRAKGGGAPFVKFDPSEFPIGTEEEAKAKILENYNKNLETCNRRKEYYPDFDEECDPPPAYQEFMIDGITVYASMDTGTVWGEESWTSILGFEKDGRKVIFILYDKADLYMEELNLIISTLKFVER